MAAVPGVSQLLQVMLWALNSVWAGLFVGDMEWEGWIYKTLCRLKTPELYKPKTRRLSLLFPLSGLLMPMPIET